MTLAMKINAAIARVQPVDFNWRFPLHPLAVSWRPLIKTTECLLTCRLVSTDKSAISSHSARLNVDRYLLDAQDAIAPCPSVSAFALTHRAISSFPLPQRSSKGPTSYP